MARKRSLSFDTTNALLDVYMQSQLVGHMGHDGANVWFRYTESAVEDPEPDRLPLSVRLPVTGDTYGHDETLAFFDNLLLESDTRSELALAAKRDVRDTAGILGRVGAECAGAVSIWPHDVPPPDADEYQNLSSSEIEALFNDVHGSRVARVQLESRQSMSGVQQKLVFRRRDADVFALPVAGSPTTVIVKRASTRYAELAANELICLRMFGALSLTAVDAAYFPDASDLLQVTRYDRSESGSRVVRLHQEDLCQATGRPPIRKHQYAGGPGMREISDVIRRYSHSPAQDIRRLVRSAIANICLGNMDAHAKNYSLLHDEKGSIHLAPFYDIVSTEIYEGLDRKLSIYFGGNDDPERLQRKDVLHFAKDMHVAAREVDDAIDEIPDAISANWTAVIDDVLLETGRSDALAPMVDRMRKRIDRRVSRVQAMGVAVGGGS